MVLSFLKRLWPQLDLFCNVFIHVNVHTIAGFVYSDMYESNVDFFRFLNGVLKDGKTNVKE